MANLNDAYRSVQETIDRNNNVRQEDGGIFQSFLHDIYTDIEGDLDPANIRKPLSPYGSALDAITGFRKKQIERAADAEAAFQTAVYTANRPLEKIKRADQIRYRMEDAYRDQHYKATTGLASLYPTLKATTEDKDQLQTVIDKNPSLFKTINNAHTNGNTIKFYTAEDEIPKLAGQHIYTDPSNGNKIYSSSSKIFEKLNFAHAGLSEKFRTNLGEAGYEVEDILNQSVKDKAKLFQNPKFVEALDKTLQGLPSQALVNHELLGQALTKRLGDIDNFLKIRSSRLVLEKSRQWERVLKAKELARRNFGEYDAFYKAEQQKLLDLEKKSLAIKLDGQFKLMYRAAIHKHAYALSLLKGIYSTEDTKFRAEDNIDMAIKFLSQNPDLKNSHNELRDFYSQATTRKNTVPIPVDTDTIPKEEKSTITNQPTLPLSQRAKKK